MIGHGSAGVRLERRRHCGLEAGLSAIAARVDQCQGFATGGSILLQPMARILHCEADILGVDAGTGVVARNCVSVRVPSPQQLRHGTSLVCLNARH